MTEQSVHEQFANFLLSFIADPLGYAKYCFPWGKQDLRNSEGPRKWQAEILDTIGKHLRDPKTRFTPLKIAIASGHGIGKSSLISMVCNWGMSTFPNTRVIVTANTESQLRSKTWPEVMKWFRLSASAHMFKPTATTITSTVEGHEKEWKAEAVPWSENNTEAFAGFHNEGKRLILIFDEGSAIADEVFRVAEGAMTDANTEIIWLVFGNPTRNTGRFRELFGKYKHRWITRQIDSRTVEGVNKEQIAQWADDYGEDSDFMRVRVKGEFPRAGSMQFISSEVVEQARKRMPEAKLYDPLVMGVDIARFGEDSTVICLRRGRDARSVPWIELRGADTMQVAARVAQMYNEFRPDAIFIDGGGVGGGVIDRLNMLKVPVLEVQFGGSADRGQVSQEGAVKYANKRAEMWGNMRDWLRGGMIPDDPDLASELTGLEYGYILRDGVDAILLEKKSDMKKRGLSSPDKGDALALTFAYPISPSDHTSTLERKTSQHQVEYNPLSLDHIARN